MLIYLCFYIFYYISTLYIYVNKFNNNFFQKVHNYCLFALKGEDVKSPFKSSQTEERGQPPLTQERKKKKYMNCVCSEIQEYANILLNNFARLSVTRTIIVHRSVDGIDCY